ncbi:MAG: sulfatase-like hydrolase/transferase [Tenericutes bacterium]|nr:sulfatase-like hydrolase/transferase [Mycoplasmatota bacterium]
MKYKKMLIIFLNLLYLELIYHLFIFNSFKLKHIFLITIFTVLSTIFIDLISSLFTKKINKWLMIIINCFLSILFIAQIINYRFYGNVISIYSIIHGGQVFGFLSAIFSVLWQNIICVILLLIPIPFYVIFNKKIETDNLSWKVILKKNGLLIIVFILSLLSLQTDKKEIYSAKNLYYYRHAPLETVKKLGMLTTLRLDLERTITGFEENLTKVTDLNLPEVKEDTKNEDKIKYNIEDIDFLKLAEEETKTEIKNIHYYMANETPTKQNKYTGMFKDKNLIVITAEAFSPIAVNEALTPTLYKLVNQGFTFTNFYSPIYYVSTSDGEYVSLTSLLPKESVWSFYKSSKNYLPYVYGNVFKNLGYETYAFHDGQYKYYDRNLSHPNMGYKYMACGNGLEKLMNCKKWPQSDLEMINATFDMYSNEEKFVAYYMSISGHLEYNFYGNNMANKNKALVADTEYSDKIKAYIACQIELDKALEELINKLKEKDILDDTVIVLSADHYPYGLTNDDINSVTPLEDAKFDIHKNNLIIWSNTMKKNIKIDKIAESLDILPTILNLFGINYDSRLLIGKDILSDTDGLVILNDRSWITKYGKYNTSTQKFTSLTEEEIPENYVNKINEIVANKFVISKNILDTNYYKHVFKEEQ